MDAVLKHYTDDFKMSSPMIRRVLGVESGVLKGKGAVGDDWRAALETVPDLKFSMREVACGIDSVSIYYDAAAGTRAIETFLFDSSGRVCKSMAAYA